MSIKLPKYSIQETYKEPSFVKKSLPVIMLICGLLFGYFGYKFWEESSVNTVIEKNKLLEEKTKKDQKKIQKLAIEISQLKAENLIKNEAVLLLQNDYKTQIDVQNGLESEINFYQQLLSPNAENQGLRVFESRVIELENSNYKLDLTLVQKIQKAKIISGGYEIFVSGKQESLEKSITIDLKDEAKYEFKYFQRISLSFSLPKGFKPEQLVVKLLPQNKKTNLIEHTVSWASLTQ